MTQLSQSEAQTTNKICCAGYWSFGRRFFIFSHSELTNYLPGWIVLRSRCLLVTLQSANHQSRFSLFFYPKMGNPAYWWLFQAEYIYIYIYRSEFASMLYHSVNRDFAVNLYRFVRWLRSIKNRVIFLNSLKHGRLDAVMTMAFKYIYIFRTNRVIGPDLRIRYWELFMEKKISISISKIIC